MHSTAFRRLAGKTQVFIFPDDHQRTRLTHALEVAQVATSVARACGLNVALAEAIALGHDCGHGPGGHASEDALDPYLAEGFDHAPGAPDVSRRSLNLCAQTLDGIANHSWSRPAPATSEGEVVSWADRIAYVCHDWEDAVSPGSSARACSPTSSANACGSTRGRTARRLHRRAGRHGAQTRTGSPWTEPRADALAAFRACNYEHIYLRDASVAQGAAVVAVLRALVEHFADRPNAIPGVEAGRAGRRRTEARFAAAVELRGGNDRPVRLRQAVAVLGWDPAKLPRGIDG